MFPVLSHIPVPEVEKPVPPNTQKYPFDVLDVGQSFFAPERKLRSMATQACLWARKLDRKFRVRAATMVPDAEQHWAPAEPDAPGATDGVIVHRIA